MGYVEVWGHMMWDGERPPRSMPNGDCPACGATVEGDLMTCEWCGKTGCEVCMKRTIDGWVCDEGDCGAKLKKYLDDIDAKYEKERGV